MLLLVAAAMLVNRLLKNSFNRLLDRAMDGPAPCLIESGMHILMCLISGAQRKPRFSQATLKNGMDAFFNILLSPVDRSQLRREHRCIDHGKTQS
jgi:hypothetical protein